MSPLIGRTAVVDHTVGRGPASPPVTGEITFVAIDRVQILHADGKITSWHTSNVTILPVVVPIKAAT